MKEKITYQEKYKLHKMLISQDRLPVLNHLNDDFVVVHAELRSAGICELDGKELEFNDIRVYVGEK